MVPNPVFTIPERIVTPTLHIIGLNDTIILPEWSRILASGCVDPRVEFHEGGTSDSPIFLPLLLNAAHSSRSLRPMQADLAPVPHKLLQIVGQAQRKRIVPADGAPVISPFADVAALPHLGGAGLFCFAAHTCCRRARSS